MVNYTPFTIYTSNLVFAPLGECLHGKKGKQMKKKQLRSLLLLAIWQLIWIIPVTYDYMNRKPVEEEEMLTEDEEIIRWKDYEMEEEVTIEKLEIDVLEQAQIKSIGTFKLTAYCPCKECSGHWGKQTSTGAIATEGRTVAVDPKVIPYGTVIVVVIDGVEYEYVAEDCGGLVKGKHIDIYFDEHKTDFKYYAEVFIKESN